MPPRLHVEPGALAGALAITAGALLLYLLLRRLFYPFLDRWADRLGRLETSRFLQPVLRWVKRAVNLALLGLALLGLTLTGLTLAGVNIGPTLSAVHEGAGRTAVWLLDRGLRLALILLGAVAGIALIRRHTPRLLEQVLTQGKEGVALEEARERAQTLAGVLSGTLVAVIVGTAGFMALAELGINILPVLTGLGVASIALGLGAQHLVRDLIAGFFIVVDNQFTKGDVVRIAGIAGRVEDFNLRRTVLRDLDGTVHYIPNGVITTTSNLTHEWSRVNLDIQVAYKEDVDRVMQVINEVGQELYADDYWRDLLLEAPYALRVNDFKDSGVEIRIRAMTKPMRQWEVAGELRRRLKKRFDQEGIEIPFPHRTLYWGQGAPTLPPEVVGLLQALARRLESAPPGEAGKG